MAKTYELTGKTPKVSGQAKLVYEALKELRSADIHLLADHIEANGLETRQTPVRIAAYYISVFKSAGVVREVEGSEPETKEQTIERLRAMIEKLESEVEAETEAK